MCGLVLLLQVLLLHQLATEILGREIELEYRPAGPIGLADVSAQGGAGIHGDARRRLQHIDEPDPEDCPQALFDSNVAQMATTCCGEGGCNTLPGSCSDECRSFYLTFYESCWSTRMQKHPKLMAGFAGLHDLCSQPVSACMPALFATSITQMGLKCCPTDVDCNPPPIVCTEECSAFYVPFHTACSSEMAALGADQEAVFTSIYDLCSESSRHQESAPARTLNLGRPASGFNLYFVTLLIGSPPRPFRLHLDTGSSGLYVPATYSSCPTCDPHFDRGFDVADSATATIMPCSDLVCGTSCGPSCGKPGFVSASGSTVAGILDGDNECRQRSEPMSCEDCDDDAHSSCRYSSDGDRDDGSTGGTAYCASGTDERDCNPDKCCTFSCCSHGLEGCSFISMYGDGSGLSGKLVRDNIAFGGTQLHELSARALFGVFDKVHGLDSGGPFEPPLIDGIFGVAGSELLDAGQTPVLDTILTSSKLENLFALCLARKVGSRSTIDIGQVDRSKFVGEMKYVGFFANQQTRAYDYYAIKAPVDTQVGGKFIKGLAADDYKQSGHDTGKVLIDSGSSSITLRSSVFWRVTAAIVAGASASARAAGLADALNQDPTAGRDTLVFYTAADYDPDLDFPIVKFWLTDYFGARFSLDLAPSQYLRAIDSGLTDEQKSLEWVYGLSPGDETIFGAPVMQAYYTVFDRTNLTLGFAPVSQKCGNHLQGAETWPVYGCTNPSFLEYDSAASADDPQACVTRRVEGCLSPNFQEYDPLANVDTDPSACCNCKAKLTCPDAPATCSVGCDAGSCWYSGGAGCVVLAELEIPHLSRSSDGSCACAVGFHVNSTSTGCETDGESCSARYQHTHEDSAGSCVCDVGWQLIEQFNECTCGSDSCCACDARGGQCGTNDCVYHSDSECDDGSQGGHQFCDPMTDCSDCGNCCGLSGLRPGCPTPAELDKRCKTSHAASVGNCLVCARGAASMKTCSDKDATIDAYCNGDGKVDGGNH